MDSKSNFGDDTVFRLSSGVRIRAVPPYARAEHRVAQVMLAPEKIFFLEHSEAAILACCRGEVSFRIMVDTLGRHFEEEVTPEFTESIRDYLQKLREERLIAAEEPARDSSANLTDYLSRLDQVSE